MSLRTLMTSEFTEGYTPDELKNLLLEFRNEYRKLESQKIQLERKIEKQSNDIKGIEKDINVVVKRNNVLELRIKKLRERKLTMRERFTGKIKT